MCSNTLGPAMSPDLVTWPTRKMGMSCGLATCSRAVAHSLTCGRGRCASSDQTGHRHGRLQHHCHQWADDGQNNGQDDRQYNGQMMGSTMGQMIGSTMGRMHKGRTAGPVMTGHPNDNLCFPVDFMYQDRRFQRMSNVCLPLGSDTCSPE